MGNFLARLGIVLILSDGWKRGFYCADRFSVGGGVGRIGVPLRSGRAPPRDTGTPRRWSRRLQLASLSSRKGTRQGSPLTPGGFRYAELRKQFRHIGY